jgi:very-long-chain (3R)-3-hydroxyacyl-CoA dehydratase
MTIYSALPVVEKSRLYSLSLPNQYNMAFNFHYYLCFLILSYVPGQ